MTDTRKPVRTETQISAGGAVVRRGSSLDPRDMEIALVSVGKPARWQLPKGISGERVRYHKFVYFYMMWYFSGDVSDHDHEVNEACWVPAEDAVAQIAFRSERGIVEKALQIARAKGGP